MSEPMKNLYNAVIDCLEQFNQRNYDYKRAIAYAHPNAIKEARRDSTEWVAPGESLKVNGVTVDKSQHVPENMVVLVHVDAAKIGDKGIAFAQMKDGK